ncbi:MAG: S41 family peptidase [Xanthomonadales bacterium]|nr:S41 family peptidase [Xanthomonadales bacterium]
MPTASISRARRSRNWPRTVGADYVGVGLELVRREDGRVGVLATIDGGPASRADVRAGDLIAAIDGEAIAAGTAIGEVIARLRGPPGSEVGLTLEREGRDGLLMVRLKRERIRVGSVRAEPLGEDVLYLRVAQFHEGTAGEIRRALERRLGSGGRSLAGLVLDLRQNPGGLLHVAVEVADLFLEAGVVVRLVGRHAGQSAEFSAGPGDLLAGVPIAVLIDGGTASAAEIVAAALRDRGRARLIGEPSFGKGSVQTIVPLSEREAIKLTTARLHAPGGQVLDGSGLEPDLRVAGGGPAATEPSRDAVVRAALAWLRGLRPGTGAAAAASRGSGPRAGRGG